MTGASESAIVIMYGVSKSYGRIQALDEVELTVNPGEVLAVLGPNGAGKTTAISLMTGLMEPDRGEVRLFGGSARDAIRSGRVGVMLQVSGVPENLRVIEHLELFSSYYPDPMPMDELLTIADLKDLTDRLYGQLSGGQKQRVLFALAICGRPRLVFLDEPTNGMDVNARIAFWEQIRTLVGQGASIVLSTHYLEEADAVSDRIVLMDQGRVIAEGSPETIKKQACGKWVRCSTSLDEQILASLPGVTAVEQQANRFQLTTTEVEQTVASLMAKDPGLSNLEITAARLEDAFIHLTQQHQEEVYA